MLQRMYTFRTKTIFLELFLLALLINAAQAASANSDTALSALFVDTTWLRDNRNMVVVIDARSEKDFRKGHIPGAISAPWQSFTHMEGKPGRPAWGTLLPPKGDKGAQKAHAVYKANGVDVNRMLILEKGMNKLPYPTETKKDGVAQLSKQ